MVKGASGSESRAAVGDEGEALALRHLLRQGLVLVQRNYRVARGPRARAGEIDLVMREPDGTLVFVEVRRRGRGALVAAAATVTAAKQRSLILAARHYLQRLAVQPRCRFDVVAIDDGHIEWIRAAFDAA